MTEQAKDDFERLLKTGLKIIFGQYYTTFDEVIRESNIRTMRQVRSRIVNKLVRKTTRALRVCTPVNGYSFRKLSFIKD